jgi:hypothetical protein
MTNHQKIYYDIPFGSPIPEDAESLFINQEERMPEKLPNGLRWFFANAVKQCDATLLPAGLRELYLNSITEFPKPLPENLMVLSLNSVKALPVDCKFPARLGVLYINGVEHELDFSRGNLRHLKRLLALSVESSPRIGGLPPNLQNLSVGADAILDAVLPDSLFYLSVGDKNYTSRAAVVNFWNVDRLKSIPGKNNLVTVGSLPASKQLDAEEVNVYRQ